jgi:penicillin-insensitive murein endopeptidase
VPRARRPSAIRAIAHVACLIAALVLVLGDAGVAAARGRKGAAKNPWAKVKSPARGSARAIGYYSAGCLVGGRAVDVDGKGFTVMNPQRGRHYAHKSMVRFIRDLAAAVTSRGLDGLSLGDFSQPRGGPAPRGHASHQTGLDADIWYARGAGDDPDPVPMVDRDTNTLTAAWGPAQEQMVTLAARDRRVDRIFVHPVIKRALCASATGDRSWLRKVRSWWGHDEHFHVRLSCPRSDRHCKPGETLPEGDACDDADWWLSPESQTALAERRKLYRDRIGVQPRLPARCSALVERRAARDDRGRSGRDRAASPRKSRRK